ncbi:hypothetical protein [Conchiformibius kuhniae]|uniref:Phosphoribosylglycinamide formyltransferase n=1 Tax=Conchiformibius kuhniae TaxID=211502 RepID=A0A8T9MUI6_9NEIS|nr:hypothetical protein [Conchiformibius kuhniae]UOP04891.1 phosphoribosylglycinamide formyltransferase [Conchiformibius kuhniae]
MQFSKDDKINNLVTEKVRAGWQVRKGKKHKILIAPNRQRIAIPATPSDYRAFLNFSRDVRRLAEGLPIRVTEQLGGAS